MVLKSIRWKGYSLHYFYPLDFRNKPAEKKINLVSQLQVLLPWEGGSSISLEWHALPHCWNRKQSTLFSAVYLKSISSQKTVTCSVFDPNTPVILFSLHYPSQNDSLPMLYYLSVHSKNISLTLIYIKKARCFKICIKFSYQKQENACFKFSFAVNERNNNTLFQCSLK